MPYREGEKKGNNVKHKEKNVLTFTTLELQKKPYLKKEMVKNFPKPQKFLFSMLFKLISF
jgi:hypothetical protein